MMKKWSLSLVVVALLFCVTVEGLRSAPETENTQTISDAQLSGLLERITKLEQRVAELEKKGVVHTLSVETAPHAPNRIHNPVNVRLHKSVNPQLPRGWSRKQFNGMDYFIVPLSATENK